MFQKYQTNNLVGICYKVNLSGLSVAIIDI